MSPLEEYKAKRDFEATPEPAGKTANKKADESRFVIQQHSATRLHWDLRSERDGVLVSWALPRGVPWNPEGEPSRGPHRGSSARVPRLPRRHPGRQLRRGQHEDLGHRDLRDRGVGGPQGRRRVPRRAGRREVRAVRHPRQGLDDPSDGSARRPRPPSAAARSTTDDRDAWKAADGQGVGVRGGVGAVAAPCSSTSPASR